LHGKLSKVYCQNVEIWKILQITCSFDKIFSFSVFFFLFSKKKIKNISKNYNTQNTPNIKLLLLLLFKKKKNYNTCGGTTKHNFF